VKTAFSGRHVLVSVQKKNARGKKKSKPLGKQAQLSQSVLFFLLLITLHLLITATAWINNAGLTAQLQAKPMCSAFSATWRQIFFNCTV
jgi:hypothetical protein